MNFKTNLDIMYFPEATEKHAVTMAVSKMVCYLALGLGFTLNAFLNLVSHVQLAQDQ